jgi:uncharacterized protein YecT (DUF1311 family)
VHVVGGFVGLLIALIISTIGSMAADFKTLDGPGVSILEFTGRIVDGDAEKFLTATAGRKSVMIILQSPGGLVKEALEIGATIRTRGYSTLAPPGEGCYSSCALIWVSGAKRYMSPDSIIGFHAAYVEENGQYRESGVANAEIGAYLNTLGLRIEAIRFFTTAGPDNFLTLSPVDARALGVDIFEIEGDKVSSPEAEPTLDIFADRFVSYGVLQARCDRFFHADTAILRNGSMLAFAEGNRVASSEEWINLWLQISDVAKGQMNEKGALPFCVEAEANLRKQGQQTGISGPAFNCSDAETANEVAMCSSPNLWPKDRAISSIYFWIRNNADKSTRKRMLDVQRRWLKIRDECSGDVTCLNTVYDTRIAELKTIDPPD